MAIVNDPNATVVDDTTVADTATTTDTTVDANATSVNTNPYITTANQTTVDATQNATSATVDPNATTANSTVSDIVNNFDTNKFLIGLAIGAAGAYLLTNENAQKAMFKTFAKGSELFTAGIEEMKERFEDAKAEMAAKA